MDQHKTFMPAGHAAAAAKLAPKEVSHSVAEPLSYCPVCHDALDATAGGLDDVR